MPHFQKSNRNFSSGSANLSEKFLESALKSTGKSIDTWYTALDNFEGTKYEHAVLVTHLMNVHKIGQWEADAIVYSYHSSKGQKTAQNAPHKSRSPRRNRNKNKNKPSEKKS